MNLAEELISRRSEFTSVKHLSVFAGSWNVNGGKNMYNVAFRHEQSLVSWLFPLATQPPCDIYAVGLEEIVDLNASNIVNAGYENINCYSNLTYNYYF